jgi:hypothetical protein
MCEAASGVNTKDKVLWIPQFNSHYKILKHFGITDTEPVPDFVKWECTPPIKNGMPDYNAPLDDWIFRIDQDRLPDWAVPELEEKRARQVLPDWYKSHIDGKCTDARYVVFSGGDGATLKGGYRATLTGGDNATLTGGDDATLTGGDGAVLIVRWYDDGWHVLTKIITKKTSGNTYQVVNGKWKCIRKAEGAESK